MAQRFEGRNLEEALTKASQTLGVERYQVSYHVVSEKRGFLGGVKRLVIEAQADPTATAPAGPPPAQASLPPTGGRARTGGARPSRPRGRDDRPRGRGSDHGNRGRRERHFEEDDIPIQGDESAAALRAREWCEELFAIAGLELVVRTREGEDKIDVRLYGRDTRRVVDRDGELLDSLQVVANKALVDRETGKPLDFDCSGFKEGRDEELRDRALTAADQVRRDGREQLLPPMNPAERRIVHLALQNDADVATESRGDTFLKRVAIIPKRESEPPAEP